MILTLFEAVQKAYTRPDLIIEDSWDEIAVFLTTFNKCKNKEDMMLFNLWQFDPQGELGRKYIYENETRTERYEEIPHTIRRCKANAEGVWGLVLDYDGAQQISEVQEWFEGLEYILYTTFRHTKETNKFRVVLPFTRLATRREITAKTKSITETFQEVDHASFSESQSFYLHSGLNKKNSYAYYSPGYYLDPDWFDDEIIPEYVPAPVREFTGGKEYYKTTLIQSLSTCSGLHYAGVGTQHGVLTLVALCKTADISFAEYDMLCQNMAASDSSLKQAQQRKSAWDNWVPYSGITSKVREEFIAAYNGSSKFGRQTKLDILKWKLKQLKELNNG